MGDGEIWDAGCVNRQSENRPLQRLGGGGGDQGGGEIDGTAIGKLADALDDFVDGFFPFVGRSGGDHFFEGGGEFAGAQPGFFGRTGPGPNYFVLGGMDVLEASGGESLRELGLVREAKDVRGIGRWSRGIHIFGEGTNHGAEERVLLHRAPGDEGDATAGFKNATNFVEGFRDVGKKHDAEARGDAVEVAVGEWEMIGVSNLEFDIGEAASGRRVPGRRGAFRGQDRWRRRGPGGRRLRRE